MLPPPVDPQRTHAPHDAVDTGPLADPALLPVPPAARGSILFGPYGLRAGWSLLTFLAFIVMSWAVGSALHAHFHPAPHPATVPTLHEQRPVDVLSSHGIPLALFLFFTWIMAKIEGRRFGVYGFGGRQRVRDCVNGVMSGVLSLSLLVGVLWACRLLVFDGVVLSGAEALVYALKWLAAFALVGLTEEYMFRGYLQYTLTRGLSGLLPHGSAYRRMLGFWLSAILLSFLFFQGHRGNPGESPIGLLSVFLIGLVLAYSLWRTGSLWWAIGFHATWDFMQSYFYGVGDSGIFASGHLLATHPQGRALLSGGLTGPEGSLFVIPIGIVLCLVIRFTLPQREQPTLDTRHRHPPANPHDPASSIETLQQD